MQPSIVNFEDIFKLGRISLYPYQFTLSSEAVNKVSEYYYGPHDSAQLIRQSGFLGAEHHTPVECSHKGGFYVDFNLRKCKLCNKAL